LGHGSTVCEAAHVARPVARGKGVGSPCSCRPLAADLGHSATVEAPLRRSTVSA
jgi:hypothetical protein